jgi:ribosomal-protein-alanine N-acetyltransferase
VIEKPSLARQTDFLTAVRRSRTLFRRWVDPPATGPQYREFVRRLRGTRHIGHFICDEDGRLAGVININEIVRGRFRSGYLGYYAFTPFAGRGYMRAGLSAVLRRAFGEYRLHRLEANIQPSNAKSIALVESLGFTREGYSPRYLKISGRWCDHERWALTAESWQKRDG